jgi:hypothetical protein
MSTAALNAESATMSSAAFQPTLSSATIFTLPYPLALRVLFRSSYQPLLCPFSLRPPR